MINDCDHFENTFFQIKIFSMKHEHFFDNSCGQKTYFWIKKTQPFIYENNHTKRIFWLYK